MKRNVLKSSLQNAYFSIIFQILCRGLTFGINAFIVRKVGRDVLGVMNVRLLLLESTLLFLSREAITRAGLSATTQEKNKCSWPQLINQIWLTVPICIILTLPCLYIWLEVLSPVGSVLYQQYEFGCFAVAISCIIELCAEMPLFTAQIYCFVKFKIFLDTLHIFVRSLIFLWIVFNNKDIAIFAFGVAQLSSAFTIVFGHYFYFNRYIKQLRIYKKRKHNNSEVEKSGLYANMDDFPFSKITDMFPGVLPNEGPTFNSELQILTLSFVKQGVLKQILTEGEKYVMSVSPVLSFSEQATYDIVNNLGSLAARFIFRPIEDSSYFYFTQTIARDVVLKDQDQEKVNEASNVLKAVCKTVSSIGLMALIFGQSYSGTVLLLYGGSEFVAGGVAEMLLKWHCLAICFLAVNGITEGYMFATNTSQDIDKYNYYMAVFSVLFLLLSYVLTNLLGPVGFILANCTNMFLRICYSTYHINKQYKNTKANPLDGLIPGKFFLITLLITGGLCKFSEMYLERDSIFKHIVVGSLCVVLTLLSWALENRDLVRKILRKYSTKIKRQ